MKHFLVNFLLFIYEKTEIRRICLKIILLFSSPIISIINRERLSLKRRTWKAHELNFNFNGFHVILFNKFAHINRHRIVNKSMSDKKFFLFPFHPLASIINISSFIHILLCVCVCFVYVFFKNWHLIYVFHHLKKYYYIMQDLFFNYFIFHLTVSILDFD